jgi:NTP pyrophosphatase (non-canonical NTP hydrolase)
MTFADYSKQAITTDSFDGRKIADLTSPAFVSKLLGLVGESGEVAEKCKKILRDKKGSMAEQDVQELQKELGDVLWYINALSLYLGCSLEETAQKNLEKVLDRKKRGVTSGKGDNR